MHVAARYSASESSLATVQALIDAGAKLDLQDFEGSTALHVAALWSSTESLEATVQALIDAGANVDLQDQNEWTALHHAARYSSSESSLATVQALIDAGADIDLNSKDWVDIMQNHATPASREVLTAHWQRNWRNRQRRATMTLWRTAVAVQRGLAPVPNCCKKEHPFESHRYDLSDMIRLLAYDDLSREAELATGRGRDKSVYVLTVDAMI